MSQSAVKQQSSSNAKSVGKTFAILSTFSEATPIQRTSDIASKLHMNISTVSRHLNTMLDWGYLQRDDATGFYSLGLEIVALAGAALQNSSIYRFAYPELQRLSYKYGVHSHMSVPRGVEVVHLISICCENTMELLIPMGHCHPMYCSAMGRAIMAYQSSGEVQRVLRDSDLKKFTPETKVELQEIQQELARTRQRGYCMIFDELSENIGSGRTYFRPQPESGCSDQHIRQCPQSQPTPERTRIGQGCDHCRRKDFREIGLLPQIRHWKNGRP